MKKQKGFPLIELLVVIAIIGIMATLVIVNLTSVSKKSRDAKRKTDLAEMKTALESYFDDNVTYPDVGSSAFASCSLTNAVKITNDATNLGVLTPDYLQEIPEDPRGTNDYKYCGDSAGYYVYAILEKDGSTYTVQNSN